MKSDSEKIEKALRNSIIEYTEKPEIQSQISEAFYIWKSDTYSITEYASEDDIDDEAYSKFFDWFVFDFKTFDKQKRVVEQFRDESLDNLDKEELTVLNDWITSYQSFFEVIKIDSGVSCVIRDIFTGDELLVYDKAVSSGLGTVDIISARPLKTGDIIFFSGIISIYPNIFRQIIVDYFKKEFDVYKSEHGENASVAGYLKDFGFLIGNYIEDMVSHPQLISLGGDEFLVATADYSFHEKKPVSNLLNQSKELTYTQNPLDKNDYYFLEKLEDKAIGAIIEVKNASLTITCNTKNKLIAARSFIKSVLADFISHNNDNFKKLDSYIENTKKIKYKLPRGFRSRKKFETTLDDFYKEWIDRPLDALSGSTPREALKTPEGRNKLENVLIELEKLYDNARKAGEPYYEVSKLRELLQNSLN